MVYRQLKSALCGAFFVAALGSSLHAATLEVDAGSGILLGAKNVVVDGVNYDVTFASGTCISRFNGCDSASDFSFSNLVEASAAAAALRDQVFLDLPLGAFDTSPALTFGCGNPSQCLVTIPFLLGGDGVIVAVLANGSLSDQVSNGSIAINAGISGAGTYALFSLADVSAVPIPGALPLFASALGLGGFFGWKRKRKAATVTA
jgi:hypothetical protein